MTESEPKAAAQGAGSGPVAIGRLTASLGFVVLAGSAISFCGWIFDIPRLTDWFDSGVSIQPNTCVLLMLAAIALILLERGMARSAGLVGAFVMLAGALTFLQYVVNDDFGFNHQLMFGREWGQATTASPGRMGPPASSSFALIGLALVLLGRHPEEGPEQRRFVPLLAIAVCVIGAFSVIGYVFDARPLYTVPWLTAIARQTGLMLTAIAIGLLLRVPERQPLRLLLSDSGAGALARRILPALLVLPVTLGWLRTKGEALGYFDTGTGRALLVLSIILLSAALLWPALLALARNEEESREQARVRLRDQRHVADTLRRADQRKDEFIAILAHELRGPLAPLRNTTELLKRADGDARLLARAREIMERQLRHLARLVDDLLDVSRITRDRIEIRREPVELRELLRACAEAMRPMIDAKEQALRLELPPDPVHVDADPVRLTQVFNNILHNASKYTPNGGRIACVAGQEAAQVVVSIQDNGVGIEPGKIQSVFDMFTQLEEGQDRAHGGLGIGLTLARRLVELHGGSVAAHSDGRDRGAEFVIQLPLRKHGAVDEEGVRPAGAGLRAGVRFLVVDDNADSATSLAMLLSLSGHETATAHDGLEAVAAAAQFRPQVVLLDIGLPKIDGYEACRRIRAQPAGGSIVMIALTGWGQDKDREKSRDAGFDHHLVKPVDFQELLALVGPLLSRQPAA